MEPLRIGISSCLLGDPVRWDGSHERRDFLAEVLGPRVTWVKACPELEAGLGVPREPIAFVHSGPSLKLLGARSREEMGPRLAGATRRILAGASDLDGYILKSRSPSCGLDGARVYATPADLFADGAFERAARGVFAARLVAERPDLPVVDETMLLDRTGREHFVERCFAARRVREVLAGDAPIAALPGLTEAFELQVLTRSAAARVTLVRLAARAQTDAAAASAWRSTLAAALAAPPPFERLVGVVRRAALRLGTREAKEMAGRFAAGEADLDDTRAELLRAARRASDALLLAQTFLDPCDEEQALRRAIRDTDARP